MWKRTRLRIRLKPLSQPYYDGRLIPVRKDLGLTRQNSFIVYFSIYLFDSFKFDIPPQLNNTTTRSVPHHI
jgi:hypothetical protein